MVNEVDADAIARGLDHWGWGPLDKLSTGRIDNVRAKDQSVTVARIAID